MQTRSVKLFFACSFAGHIALLSVFSLMRFSIARAPKHMQFKPALYFGQMQLETMPLSARRDLLACAGPRATVPRAAASMASVSMDYHAKPQADISYMILREPVKSPPITVHIPQRNEPAFTLHPLLPYQFDLYFKDRQVVHIELEFSITRGDKRNFVSLRRKISSGNLEADLLSMRYIGHYLFIQQARFMADVWQTVKIEFSPNTR